MPHTMAILGTVLGSQQGRIILSPLPSKESSKMISVTSVSVGDFLSKGFPLEQWELLKRGTTALAHAQNAMPEFDLPPGFQYIRTLGAGGMGTVILVNDLEQGFAVAMKIRRTEPDASGNDTTFKREFREVMAMSSHHNLVRVYKLLERDGVLYYTMEFVDGEDLAAIIAKRKGALASPQWVEWILGVFLPQMVEALETIHLHGYAHRDVKPANIFVTKEGLVKLGDFGLIYNMDPEVVDPLPHTGFGTLYYMAPEQIRREPVSQAMDWYALGIILYEMMTGSPPFTLDPTIADADPRLQLHKQLEKLSIQHTSEIPPRLEGIPPKLAMIVAGLLEKNPLDRPFADVIRSVLNFQRWTPLEPIKLPHEFVGRQKEIKELDESLNKTRNEGARVVLIKGKSGMGKTALAETMIQRARDFGCRTFLGRIHQHEAIPYNGLDSLMDAIAITLGKWNANYAPIPRIDELGPLSWLFPVFGENLPITASLPPHMDAQNKRRQAIRSFRVLMEILTQGNPGSPWIPLLLVLDDLQWSDAESLKLLEELMKECANLPILILGTVRSEDFLPLHPLSEFKKTHSVPIREIEVGGMGATDVQNLLEQIGVDTPMLVQLITEQTGGNPFFVEEIGRSLALSQAMPGRGWVAPSLEGLLTERLKTLSNEARELVKFAAATGGAVSRSFLRDVAVLDPKSFSHAVMALVEAHIFRSTHLEKAFGSIPPGGMAGTFDSGESLVFYHDGFRQVAYNTLPCKPEMHSRLAIQLETKRPEERDDEALFFQWELAGDQEKAIRYGLLAAKKAGARLAFGRAAEIYEQVIQKRENLGGEKTREYWQGTLRLYKDFVRVLEPLGTPDRVTNVLHRALEIAETHSLKLEKKQFDLDLASHYIKTGNREEGDPYFVALLAKEGLLLDSSMPEVVMLRVKVIATLGADSILETFFKSRRRDPTEQDNYRVDLRIKMFESYGFVHPLLMAKYNFLFQLLAARLNHPRAQVLSLCIEAIYQTLTGLKSAKSVRKALDLIDRAEKIRMSEEDKTWMGVYPLGVRGFIYLAVGQWDRARKNLEEAVRYYEHHNSSELWQAAVCRIWLMLAYYYGGPEEKALDLAHAFRKEGKQNVVHSSFGMWVLNGIYLRHGHRGEVKNNLKEWEKIFPKDQPMTYVRALYEASENAFRVADGSADQALENYKRVKSDLGAIGFLISVWEQAHSYLPLLEGLTSLARDRDKKLTLEQKKEAIKIGNKIGKEAPAFFACLAYRCLALIEDAGGNKTKAVGYLKESLKLSKEAGVEYHRWLCLMAASEVGLLTTQERNELKAIEQANEDDSYWNVNGRDDAGMVVHLSEAKQTIRSRRHVQASRFVPPSSHSDVSPSVRVDEPGSGKGSTGSKAMGFFSPNDSVLFQGNNVLILRPNPKEEESARLTPHLVPQETDEEDEVPKKDSSAMDAEASPLLTSLSLFAAKPLPISPITMMKL